MAIVVLLLAFASVYVYANIPKQNTLPVVGGASTSSSSALASSCASAPIESELTTYNSQAISAGTVAVYQNGAKLSDASTAQTLNTYNSASSYYSAPWTALWNASAAYPQSFQVNSVPSTDANGNSVVCQVPAGSSNAVNVYLEKGLLYLGPALGTSALTNVESVIGSTTGQTNSFPAAFPTSSLTITAYLQGFANSIVGMRPVAIPSSTNQPITDYGGVFNSGTAIQEPVQSVKMTSGLVYFYGYAVFIFNQTAIAFSGPAGTTPLTISGQTGEKAFAVPATSLGACASAGVGTGSPCILSQVSVSIQETIAATGKHIDMMVVWVDNTQLGYMAQYISTPAVTAFHAAGNFFGLPASMSGLYAPVGGTTGGVRQVIVQSSAVIATY